MKKIKVKMYNHQLPIPLMNIIQKNTDTHRHNTRHKNDFAIPMYKYDVVHRSFLCTGPSTWINIPSDIKT